MENVLEVASGPEIEIILVTEIEIISLSIRQIQKSFAPEGSLRQTGMALMLRGFLQSTMNKRRMMISTQMLTIPR